MNTIFSRTSKNAQRFFFALAAVISIAGGFFVANVALAAHTATVTVSPTLVKGGSVNTPYTFNIQKNDGNDIVYVKIQTSNFTINNEATTISCPTGLGTWNKSVTNSQVVCQKDFMDGQAITASAVISFQASAPGSDVSSFWVVTTIDSVGSQFSSSPVTTVDATAPTVSSITTKDVDGDGKVDTATIVFSEAVLDSSFVADNFNVGGSAGTSISTGTADDNTFDVLVSGGVSGTNAKDVTYTQGNGSDLVGNKLANVVTGTIVESDSAAPVFMSARTQSPTTIVALFSEDLNGSTVGSTGSDFTVTGHSITHATENPDNGTVVITVNTMTTGETPTVDYVDTIKDLHNNTASHISKVAADGITPVIASTRTVTPTAIEVTFSEAMSAVSKDDFTVAGNTVSSVTFTSGTTIATFVLGTPISTGATPLVSTIATPTGTKDNASVPNTITGSLTSTPVDGIAPMVVIAATSATSPTKTAPIAMIVTFSEPVTGFDATDIVVGNGTLGNFAGTGSTYTFDITSPGQGTVVANIAGGVAQDGNSNVNTVASQFSIVFDNIPPTVILTKDHSDLTVRDADTVVITATFNEPMTSAPTIAITNAGFTTAAMTGSGTTWTYSWNVPAGNDGTGVVVTVAGSDIAGNVYSDSTNLTFTIDNVAPTAVQTTPVATPTKDNTPNIGITVEDTVGWVIKNGDTALTSGTGTGAEQTITLPTLADGVYNLSLVATDTAGNQTTTSLTEFLVDTVNPTVNVGEDILAKASISKTAVATDSGSGVNASSYQWAQVSGPATLTISNPTSLTTNISALTDGAEDGTYVVRFTAVDNAGNSNTDTFTLVWDSTKPTVILTKDHSDLIVRDADAVVITASFNEPMSSAPMITIGTLITNAVMTHSTGNDWTYSWNVPSDNNGSIEATVAGSDIAGNAYSDSTKLTFTIDNVAPVMAVTAPTTVATGTTVITFTNDSDTTPTVAQCSIDNSTWVACTSGVTTFGNITGFSALSDVPFTLYLRDTDTAGNTGTAQLSLAKDTTVPSISSKNPISNGVGIDPSSDITVVFNENVVITDAQVTLKKGSDAPVTTVVDFVSGMKTATINPAVALDNNSTYTVTLTGVTDTVGNALPTTAWSFTTSASYSVDLTTGWNLISLPVVPTNTLVSSVLGSALNDVAKVQSIWKYDPATGDWNVYHPDNSGETSDFTTMTAGEGYWVDYRADATGTISGTGNLFQAGGNVPPQKALSAGWNLIGYYQIENTINTTATKALSTVAGQWTQLRTYGNIDKQFHSVIGSTTMKPGEGYWIFMKSSSYAPYLYGPGDTD